MLNCTKPSTPEKTLSMAEVHAPHVIPCIATVVVVSSESAFLDGDTRSDFNISVLSTVASKPLSSIISAICGALRMVVSCSTTARSERSDTLNLTTPAAPWKAPSMAEVQAPHVMPSTASVVVALVDAGLSSALVGDGRSVERTSASKPRSSIRSLTCSAEIFVGSCTTTALPITKLTDAVPTPSTPWKAPSTDDEHAPHVMPSTFKVVVAMCAGEVVSGLEPAGPESGAVLWSRAIFVVRGKKSDDS